MAKPRIKTKKEFAEALEAIPFAAQRPDPSLAPDEPLADYMLWHRLLDLVHEAAEGADWDALQSLLALYDAVERAGRKSEMFEAGYAAFIEDVRLPTDPARLRQFWRHAPPAFAAAIKADRGM